MIDAGFEGVVEHRYKLPLTEWSGDRRLKTIGAFNRVQWDTGMEGYSMFLLTNYLGWKREEVLVYVAEMRKALRDRSIHAYHDWYVGSTKDSVKLH